MSLNIDLKRFDVLFSSYQSFERISLLQHYTLFSHRPYFSAIRSLPSCLKALELASGNGELSVPLVDHFDDIQLSDLSLSSCSLLRNKFSDYRHVSVLNLSLDSFASVSDVSVIVVANSLSYVDLSYFIDNLNQLSLAHPIYFAFIDVLNSHWLYKMYRLFLLKVRPRYRTNSAYSRLLTNDSLDLLNNNFTLESCCYSGRSTFFVAFLNFIFPFRIFSRRCRSLDLLWKFLDRVLFFFPPFKVSCLYAIPSVSTVDHYSN